jgi:phenylalanyl-tRNA synthetase beta chain
LTATQAEEGTYKVLAPFWRGDVLHECDVLEDIAICYGYTKIVPTLPPATTVGGRVRINKYTDFLRQEMAQAQFNEVLNFALCSRADLTTNIFNEDESKLIKIENAKTKEFQTGRTSLLPGLLRTIYENKSNPLPYKLFEAGDCIIVDKSTDTGSSNLRKLAAVLTDEILEGSKKGIFSIVHGALDVIMKKSNLTFGKDYKLVPTDSPFFFPGQQFSIILNG